MTMKITEDCIACGACVPGCPPNRSVNVRATTITQVRQRVSSRLHCHSELRYRMPVGTHLPWRTVPGNYAICAQQGIISTTK